MGMDVYGVENKEAYFRANVWSWRSLNFLMYKLGLIEDDLFNKMSCNDGEGPDAEKCKAISHGLKKWLAAHPNIETFGFTPDGEQFEQQVLGALTKLGAETSTDVYTIKRSHIQEFVNFLDDCGGFEVW